MTRTYPLMRVASSFIPLESFEKKCARPPIDSTRENRRQGEFNNRGAQVRRRVDRRSVGWLCRRGGRRLRVCWPAGAGGRDGGGSGYWRAGRTGVCGRQEEERDL